MTDIFKITLLYDKPCLPQFSGGWGLSFWIEYTNERILFDCGWNGDVLINNIKNAGLDVRSLTYIFLSHIHWDHIGGLMTILNQGLPNLKAVILPQAFSKHFKTEISYSAPLEEIVKSSTPCKIAQGIWSSGVMGDNIEEHSLLLKLANNQILIIAGCSHPSPTNFLESASTLGEVYGIMGGFHGFKSLQEFEHLKLIVPIHCTKKQSEILTKFPASSRLLKVGEEITL